MYLRKFCSLEQSGWIVLAMIIAFPQDLALELWKLWIVNDLVTLTVFFSPALPPHPLLPEITCVEPVTSCLLANLGGKQHNFHGETTDIQDDSKSRNVKYLK